MSVSYRQRYRLLRPMDATRVPGDRVARPATSTARPGRRTTVATATAGTITRMRPWRTRDRTQRTADQSGRTGDRAPIATPPVDAVQAGAPLRYRYGNYAFWPVQRDQRLVLHGQAACACEPGSHRCDQLTGRHDHRSCSGVQGPRTVRTAHRAHPSNALHRATSDRPNGRRKTASANTLLHRASGKLHPKTDDRTVARAQQAGESS